MQAEPFTVAIPDAALEDLRSRIERTKFPRDFGNEDWRYGMNREYLESFLSSWAKYDWRETESRINAFANYRVMLDGVPLHFIHERGQGPDPVPLILTHGWPWTFWDWEQVIRPLTDPAAHGGDPIDAFDVVVPSLPGFGFSTPLEVDGVQTVQAVDMWARLMSDVLGYERYATGGGDFGAMIAMQLGQQYPDRVRGVYVTSAGGGRRASVSPPSSPPSTLTILRGILDGPTSRMEREDFAPDEAHWYDQLEERWVDALAHVAVHTTDPQTIAYALHDSPAGLAAWLVERRRNWSDNDGDVEQAFSRQFLLDLVSIYWLTDSFFTSARWYWHTFRTAARPPSNPEAARQVPLGIAVSPRDLVYSPKRWVEESANLTHWTEHPKGGHFGPAEQPALFVEDVRTFFRPLR